MQLRGRPAHATGGLGLHFRGDLGYTSGKRVARAAGGMVMDQEKIRVLVVDDEPSIREFLQLGLEYEGFLVSLAEDGSSALRRVHEWKPHVVILDIMMPRLDGLEVCRALRQDPNLIVIFLSAKDQVEDRIRGLDLGADDYLVKPFSFKELMARIRLRLRRLRPVQETEKLRVGELSMDVAGHQVWLAGQPINLSAREFDLLRVLMLHPGQVLSKQTLLDRVWGYDYFGDDNVVEVYIRYLREKLGDRDHNLIQTVRGAGYRLEG